MHCHSVKAKAYRGKTFMAVMVNIHFSEFLRNSTLMASGNSAVCQNKSPAWPSPGLVCPGGRLFMRISLTVTAHLRDEQGMKGGPYLAGIALWPPGPWDLLSTSNPGDQGPAMGHAHRGCSLGVGVRSGEFSPGRSSWHFLNSSSLSLHCPSAGWQEMWRCLRLKLFTGC